jgi:hypothetical protein
VRNAAAVILLVVQGGVVPGALVDGVLTKMASVAEDLTEAFKDEALLAKCKEKGAALMAAAQ